jgi:DMSO/TMAO reductase YedYZ molybdopterin-dependent catalytic subunit
MSTRKAARSPHALFTIEGDCHRPQGFSHLDLTEVHPYYQVADLSTVDEKLAGKGVRLRKLLDLAGPGYGTQWLTFESIEGFSACLPLEEIAKTGVLVYEKGGKPLSPEDGGPVRLVVPYHPDKCANVKSLARIVVSKERREDTRPSTAQAPGKPAGAARA